MNCCIRAPSIYVSRTIDHRHFVMRRSERLRLLLSRLPTMPFWAVLVGVLHCPWGYGHHDRADDIRDTTSLSGGETFIVSLGLALGLSALSSRNISFENLFIDEGFGTLDPETLATVIDSLAMLQSSQGKKVGVISHTDTMSERITTQIRIIKNGNSGSSRIEVWPQ